MQALTCTQAYIRAQASRHFRADPPCYVQSRPARPSVIPHNVRTPLDEKRRKALMIKKSISNNIGFSFFVYVHRLLETYGRSMINDCLIREIIQLCRKSSAPTGDHIMFCLPYSLPPLSSLPFSNTSSPLLSQPFLLAMPPWQITFHLAFLPWPLPLPRSVR